MSDSAQWVIPLHTYLTMSSTACISVSAALWTVQDFPEARQAAYRLLIDFGPDIGIRKSSAQATKHYAKTDLLNRLVVAVVNLRPKQIGPYMSEVLTLGVPDGEGGVVLLVPERDVPVGGRMF